MKTHTWLRLAAITLTVTLGGAALFLILRYCTGILLPFLAAAWIASALHNASESLSRRTGLPKKASGVLLLLACAVLLLGGGFLLSRTLLGVAGNQLTAWLDTLAGGDGLLSEVENMLRGVRQSALGQKIHPSLSGMAEQFLSGAASAASETLTTAAASLLSRLPRAMLSLAVGTVALFYLFFDGTAVRAELSLLIGAERLATLLRVLTRLRTAAERSLRAYMTLTVLTFAELLAGFLILGVKSPLPLAALTALVDLLPVLGVGTVLLPWSLFAFLRGETVRGVGLCILFALMYAVRQYAEPRLVGAGIGVHPLLSLLAVFAGYRLGGLLGMLLAPILLSAARALVVAEEGNSPSS